MFLGHFGIGFGAKAAAPRASLGIFAIGVWLYHRSTRPLDRTGSIALWALIGFLLAVYLSNLFGPPPPNATALASVGQAQWLLLIWAFWIDRHRAAHQSIEG